METWTVYILRCADGSNYIGCTGNFKEYILRHLAGNVEATKTRLPVVVMLHVVFPDKAKAHRFEHFLKSESGNKFMMKHFL